MVVGADVELPRGDRRNAAVRRHRRQRRTDHRRRQRRRHPGDLRQRRQRPRRFHGRGLRRARHRDARNSSRAKARREIVEGWVIIRGEEELQGLLARLHAGRAHLRRHHARVRSRDRSRAHADQRPLLPQPGRSDFGTSPAPKRPARTSAGKVTTYPTVEQVETMYPFIDPFPWSPTYNSPRWRPSTSPTTRRRCRRSIRRANYAQTTGTLKGRIVAKDGESEITGINVIARAWTSATRSTRCRGSRAT